jgi:outer membrane receptor protein involved in Fe transport
LSAGVILAAAVAASAPSTAVTPFPAAFFAAQRPNTALDMVRLLPGFALDTGDQVRGFAGSAGNVLIDGARPAAKDDPLDEILKRIPASSVVRIDVIRGGAPGIDMHGKTVLANIIRRPGGQSLVVSASETTVEDGRVFWGVRIEGSKTIGPTAWEGSILAARGNDDGAADGTRVQVTPSGAHLEDAQELSQGAAYNWKATGAVETPAWGGKLRLNASLFINPYDYTQADYVQAPPPPSLDLERDHNKQSTAEVGARYDRAVGGSASLETFVLQQFGELRYTAHYDAPDDIEFYRIAKETSESIVRSTVTLNPAPAISVETGGEGDFNWLLAHTNYIVNAEPVFVPAANVRVTEARGELFGLATWKASRTLTVLGGLRVEASHIASTGDVVSGRTFVFPKPRLLLTWSPDDADQVRLRIEREVGQLNFDDFTGSNSSLSDGAVRAGNPNLSPQSDWVYEAAYDRRFWGGAQVTFTVRHYQISDVIDRVPILSPAGDYDAAGNIGSGTKDEAALALTLPTDRLGVKNGTLSGLGTIRQSEVIDPTTGQRRSISGLHPNDWEAHFTQGLPRWKAKWGLDVFGQWSETYYRFDEIDIDKLKTYASLFGEYQPRPDFTVRLEIDNLGARAFRHVREVWPDLRSETPLEYTDIRDLHGGRAYYVRLRKTFG